LFGDFSRPLQTADDNVITLFYSHCYFTLVEIAWASVGLSAWWNNSKEGSKPQTDR